MPERLEIPERQKSALMQILRFSPKERKQLLDALKEAKPSLLGRTFTSSWTQKADVSESEAQDMFQLLASLYVSMDIADQSADAFAAEVCDAIRASKDPGLQLRDANWAEIKSYLAQLLALDNTLGVSAKASDVRSEYGNVFCTARILTDLRPVYGRDVEKGPAVAVIVHEAKISFHESGEERTKDFYVALDSDDLLQLKKLLERANRKEDSLKAAAKKGGINVLEA